MKNTLLNFLFPGRKSSEKPIVMMKQNMLGRTGIAVSEMCFGSLCMGPNQKNYNIEYCTKLIVEALNKGINFIDTAEVYYTYEPIAKAMKKTKLRPVIATKSMATTYDEMKKDIKKALKKLKLEQIDIFLLHGARADERVFEQCKGAWECLKEYKASGQIRAIGISTHSVTVTKLAADRDDVDIVFPLLNMSGLGVLQGTKEEMEVAIKYCVEKEKGVYIMKALAGGSLIGKYNEALDYVRKIDGVASVAVGIINKEELEYSVNYFNGIKQKNPQELNKNFFISSGLCKACGTCVKICPNYAIELQGRVAVIDKSKCLKCGYCVGSCKEFAIRMV